MSEIYTLAFWKDAGERALSTVLQTLLAVVSIDQIFSIGFAGWKSIALAAVGAGALSLVKSLVAALTGVKGSASLTKAVEPVAQNPVDRLLAMAPGVQILVQRELAELGLPQRVSDEIAARLPQRAQAHVTEPEVRPDPSRSADPFVIPRLGG